MMSVGQLLRYAQQLVERKDATTYDSVAEPQDNQESDDDKGDDDIGKLVVAFQNIVIRTYQGHTPVGSRNRTIAHMA